LDAAGVNLLGNGTPETVPAALKLYCVLLVKQYVRAIEEVKALRKKGQFRSFAKTNDPAYTHVDYVSVGVEN
jgi:hypothetical protein